MKDNWQQVKLIATDMDGTLTKQGKFSVQLLDILEKLAVANIPVIIVTGRSAGWVSAVVNYLPIAGAIAENGGLYYSGWSEKPYFFVEIADINSHRQRLAEIFTLIRSKYPHLQESADNQFRLTDWTFAVENLNEQELTQLDRLCRENGWGFTYSTVQCHIKPQWQTKALSLQQVLAKYFPSISLQEIVTVGDSLNDESLFSPQFPYSVGVANIEHYLDKLNYHPTYITKLPEVEGFRELADLILKTKI